MPENILNIEVERLRRELRAKRELVDIAARALGRVMIQSQLEVCDDCRGKLERMYDSWHKIGVDICHE
jgi:hypothetical protein